MTSEAQPLPAVRDNGNDVLMSGVQTTPSFSDNQDFATMFAELLGSSPSQPFSFYATPELGASTQLDFRAPMVQPAVSTDFDIPTLGIPGSEARLKDMQATVDKQNRQLLELQSLVRRLHKQCAYFREKAVTFKALYTQQQGLSERTMAALVQHRHWQERSNSSNNRRL
ncbi:hypothetical protein BKA70DRAFT_1243166 [Coprinopsis sp. MPI-PUGE-AT-0042]|nr:hypothetical protein BKA70DRAFT_1243166 [Coprinopsis sp. MPI-PUGE-AT-0042]